MSSTKERHVVPLTAKFLIEDLEDYYDIAEKVKQYFQVNHEIKKPKVPNAEAGKNFKKAEFSLMVGWKTLINKISVDPKLPQLKTNPHNSQKERARKPFSPVFSKLTKRFGILLAPDKIVTQEELKKQFLKALHFGHRGSAKMLDESNIFWWSGRSKILESKCVTSTERWSFGESIKDQLLLTKKIRLWILTEPW